MPPVRLGGKRLSVTAEVPAPAAALLRRVKGRVRSAVADNGPLTVADRVPDLHVEARDPEAAVAFLPDADGLHHDAARNGQTASLPERVASIWWYHTIELPGGVVTPGVYDHRPLLPRYGLPDDLTGRRALDVATFDGFWAFEMERRGASVVATDIDRNSALDLPPQALEVLAERGQSHQSGAGFRLAHEALGSNVERVICSVYDLDPAEVGTFDFVHVADLLLHLRSPIAALQAIRRVTAHSALIVDCFDPTLHGQVARYLGGWSGCEWWAHSLDTLAQMVVDAGFRGVDLQLVYSLGNADNPLGPWRAALRAHV